MQPLEESLKVLCRKNVFSTFHADNPLTTPQINLTTPSGVLTPKLGTTALN